MTAMSLQAEMAKAVAAGDQAQIAFVRRVSDELIARNHRIACLEQLLAQPAVYVPQLKLTPSAMRCARCLASRDGVISRERLYDLLYGGRPECD